MILPLYSEKDLSRPPVVTYALMVINVAVHGLTMGADKAGINGLFMDWGFNGYEFRLHTLVTDLFLHGDIFHLLGNMLFLWLFGPAIEDFLKPTKFLGYYLMFGIGSNLFHWLKTPAYLIDIPLIGASGAIAGLMGSFFILCPTVKIKSLFTMFYFIRLISLPAWVVLGYWFVLQLIYSNFHVGSGVAFEAHIGGFFLGFVLAAYHKYGWDIRKAFAKAQLDKTVEDTEIFKNLSDPKYNYRALKDVVKDFSANPIVSGARPALTYWYALAASEAGDTTEANKVMDVLMANVSRDDAPLRLNCLLLASKLGRTIDQESDMFAVVNFLIKSKFPEPAYNLLTDFLTQHPDTGRKRPILLKQAQIAATLPAKKEEAVLLLTDLAAGDPKDAIVQAAMYDLKSLNG